MTVGSDVVGRRRRAVAGAGARRRAARSARERILATVDELFYAEGIQAIGVQRVVAEAGVTRVTFYRHFPSKEALVVAYLEQRAERARAAVQAIIDAHPGDPRSALRAWARAFAGDGVIDEYRGCTFVNAAAEYGDRHHPVPRLAIAHRQWINDTTERLLRQAGHPHPAVAARTLLALRTGFVFSAALEDPQGWEQDFYAAHDRIVDGGC